MKSPKNALVKAGHRFLGIAVICPLLFRIVHGLSCQLILQFNSDDRDTIECKQHREYFAVIDTETNWQNEVISIGVVIARTETYHIAAEKYYVIMPECEQPSMYGYMLDKYKPLMKCERAKAISDLRSLLMRYYAEPFAHNIASCRALEKAGFQYEGTLKSNAVKKTSPTAPQ